VIAALSWLKPVVAALFSTRPNPMWLWHCLIDEARKIVLASRFKADLERLGAVRLRHEMYEPLPFFFEVAAVPFCQGLELCDSERNLPAGSRDLPRPPGVAQRLGFVAAAARLVARGDLLHGPSVAVRIAKEDEPDVIEGLSVLGWARTRSADHLDLADLHPPLH
jgi:hypothetical protein